MLNRVNASYTINRVIAFSVILLDMSQYLSWIEDPPPKRVAAGSTPVWDVQTQRKRSKTCAFSLLL